SGVDFGSGSLTISANGQIAKFLSDAPFSAPTGAEGTISFTSTLPVGIVALRGVTNAQGAFLMTPLPVTDLSVVPANTQEVVPQFADGQGWSTSLLLVNPTSQVLRGTIQFLDGKSGKPITLTINGATATRFDYLIPAKSGQRFTTSGASSVLTSGTIQL